MDRYKIIQATKYLDILNKHGFFDIHKENENFEIVDNLEDIFTATGILINIVGKNKILSPLDITDEVFDQMYDSLKILANLCMFEDTVMPTVRKIVPSKADREKMAQYILEHENDNPQK